MTRRVFLEILVSTMESQTPKFGLPQTCFVSTCYYDTYYSSKTPQTMKYFVECIFKKIHTHHQF